MLELRITTGLHRGTAFPLDGDAVRVGSDENNDVVLDDPGMPACAATFTRETAGRWVMRGADAPCEVAAGLRVALGPVGAVFANEGAPWDEATMAAGFPRSSRRLRSGARLTAAFALGAACVFALDHARLALREAQAFTPGAPAPLDAAPLRTVRAIVHPARVEPGKPPFAVVSVQSGASGFVVTEDGRVLVPGARRGPFTLERIEPRRVVFSGPYSAELAW
ncbi:FHA domain-containing protein [Trinickia caryophylli]|uniref:Inner membrane component of T3SS domain-containing protein n=1 Tax=Trinickia caryophylli TaxID=28094 RepID=A0A1X7DZ14_TRICW|nr:FHA domain-containing protein [Trinickia caryophylli]PMS14112.1 hypothetical protein C0Z17_00800 [Trinickia caryophylli]TRX17811.1 hypothetical protein FNF07_05940 [Trinickia caryophylli]WQE11422.1 FHA domain-containing protein [Trinickia caryophylli]SMF24435.1 Inner membrane component of T3SS domain-containing protein [Trinickia caryophylli]GLU32586.1 hypothetical protein Busp01_24280 [Trinickia caryophylli]